MSGMLPEHFQAYLATAQRDTKINMQKICMFKRFEIASFLRGPPIN